MTHLRNGGTSFIPAPSRTGGAAAAVAILSILLLVGCSYEHKTDGKNPIGYRIVTIDHCEYIAFHTYAAESLTHKGNCTNRPTMPILLEKFQSEQNAAPIIAPFTGRLH